MSTLKERLDRIRDGFVQSAPADVMAVMERAGGELAASGILSGVVVEGSALPSFELPDTEGAVVRSDELLGRGPLVVSFYRGIW